jgi:hypothetical protein
VSHSVELSRTIIGGEGREAVAHGLLLGGERRRRRGPRGGRAGGLVVAHAPVGVLELVARPHARVALRGDEVRLVGRRRGRPRRRERLLLRRRWRAAPFDFVAPDLPVGGVRAFVRGVAVHVPARTLFRRLVADVTEARRARLLVLGLGRRVAQGATRRRNEDVRLTGAARVRELRLRARVRDEDDVVVGVAHLCLFVVFVNSVYAWPSGALRVTESTALRPSGRPGAAKAAKRALWSNCG